jgi:3-methyladenine DNA glycosylase AlkD
MSEYILRLKESNEFFIQKAIGWALRQYARQNPTSVKHFIENNTTNYCIRLSFYGKKERIQLRQSN